MKTNEDNEVTYKQMFLYAEQYCIKQCVCKKTLTLYVNILAQ